MRVYILGAGGHAKVIVATLQTIGYDVAAVLDDALEKKGTEVLGVPVLGPLSLLHELGRVPAVVAVGANEVRREIVARFAGQVDWLTGVHPRADTHPDVNVGEGTVIFSGAVVQPGAVLGRHVIVNTGATVDHDCTVGDFCHVAPGAHLAGAVRLGEGALVGTGSSVIPGVSIGAWTKVGAGAAVIADLPPGVTAVGVPARPLAG